MNRRPVVYYQTDARWKNQPYAVVGENTTIGGSGCGPTCMAMVLATWCDINVTPLTECRWAKDHGYKAKGQGTYYGYFTPAAKRYGLKCSQLNGSSLYGNAASSMHRYVQDLLEKGYYIIACMGPGIWTKSGHYVLVYGVKDNVVYLNDPASNRKVRTEGDWSFFKKQVKYYWAIEPPEGKGKDDMTEAETRRVVREEVKAQLGITKEPAYKTDKDVPEWGEKTVQKILSLNKDAIKGDGEYFITKTVLQILVILDRLGLFRKEE